MDKLFDTGDEAITAMVAQPLLATGQTIQALVSVYGYREQAVRLWPKDKADLVLKRCKDEERINRKRVENNAALIDMKDGVGARGQVSLLERTVAADVLEATLALQPDELLQTLSNAVYVCADEELKRLAGYLIRLWRGERGAAGSATGDPPPPGEDHGDPGPADGDPDLSGYDPY